jgi:hypothetical protein
VGARTRQGARTPKLAEQQQDMATKLAEQQQDMATNSWFAGTRLFLIRMLSE